ncbi:helix-hairpin-helix domain-containing protein [Flavobacteriales bacterium]|nr:helix-hairpin-helix domain-containing protein [Flavobacteriales bacterium]
MNNLQLFFFMLLLAPLSLHGQKNDQQKFNLLEQRIETIAENTEDEDIDYTTLFDYLSYIYDHPLNINNPKNEEELQQLKMLTDIQINNLYEHINRNGKLISIYELQAVPGWNLALIKNMLPFITVNVNLYAPSISFKEMLKNSTNEVFIRYSRILEQQEGYLPIDDSTLAASPNKRYNGSPDKIYSRYRFKFRNNVSLGFTGEKDAGEQYFSGNQKNGFDFYSGHLYLRGFGKLKALALGDFHAQFGQGLTVWSGLAFGKSADVMTSKRNARGLRPYASVDENLFLRGAGATLEFGKLAFTAFGSHKKIDANISYDDTSSNFDGYTITSFQLTGLHRTPGELQDKKVISESHLGGNLQFNTRKLRIGFTGLHSDYNANVQRNLTYYNQFEFNTNKNTVLGADYNLLFKNFNFYGEVSRSANGGMAQIHGALISLDPSVALSIVYRDYQRDFQNNLSNAFAESSKNINEKGVMIGLKLSKGKKLTLNAYLDQFKFPWLKYLVDKPNTYGHDYLVQLQYKPSKKLIMYGRIRSRDKPVNSIEEIDDIDFVVAKKQTNYRYNITYKVSESFTLRNRIELVDYKRGMAQKEQGYLVYQDIIYKPLSNPFSFSFRYALFETDSYNSRVYAYENDVLYYFSIPAYYRTGSRTYLTIKYQVRKGIDVWFRWAQWHLNNVDEIGAGNELILGNTKSDIRAQVRFKF